MKITEKSKALITTIIDLDSHDMVALYDCYGLTRPDESQNTITTDTETRIYNFPE